MLGRSIAVAWQPCTVADICSAAWVTLGAVGSPLSALGAGYCEKWWTMSEGRSGGHKSSLMAQDAGESGRVRLVSD